MSDEQLRRVSAGACGAVFGAGLATSGLTRPSAVIAFLDVTGAWSPLLLYTMAGAVAVSAIGVAWVRRRAPVLCETASLPTRRDVDAKLVFGSAVFGVGWGIAGYCPGPSLVALGTGSAFPIVFVLAMVVGMALAARAESAWSARASRASRRP